MWENYGPEVLSNCIFIQFRESVCHVRNLTFFQTWLVRCSLDWRHILFRREAALFGVTVSHTDALLRLFDWQTTKLWSWQLFWEILALLLYNTLYVKSKYRTQTKSKLLAPDWLEFTLHLHTAWSLLPLSEQFLPPNTIVKHIFNHIFCHVKSLWVVHTTVIRQAGREFLSQKTCEDTAMIDSWEEGKINKKRAH